MTRFRIRFRKTSFVGALVGLLAVGFVVLLIDVDKFISALLTADYRYIFPSALFFVLGLFTRAQRWRVLLANKLPLFRAFNIMNVAYLANGLLPMRVGEVARVYLTTRANQTAPAMLTASTILVERLLDVLGVMLLGMLAVAAAPVAAEVRHVGTFGALVPLAALAMLIVAVRQRRFIEGVVNRVSKKQGLLRRLPIDRYAADFLDGLTPIIRSGSLLQALFWTGCSWLLSIVTNYMLMLAFFDRGDWVAIMLSIATASFAIAVPIVPGNIGTYETAIVLAFIALGFDETDQLVAYALAVHAQNILINLITGIIGLILEGSSLARIRGEIEHIAQASG